ncbi:biotin/lipoyl-containing protein [Candidatus Hecatella orcuttiae]|uniref:biotin/lipoyl-containing protein n=1 Tax=Candidatus Hecatella orcuttiae TaxID=1935119 RepID=UPI0028680769|nr:biotin/lipoyl-containing protein [Candidatus Hecatella orcuttiae]
MKRSFRVNVEGKIFTVEVEEIGGEEAAVKPISVEKPSLEAPAPSARLVEEAPAPPSAKVMERVVTAPLAGVVASIKCKVNDNVKAGEPLLSLEAMKMENEILSPVSGIVKRIAVAEKQDVNEGDVLVEIG